MEFSFANKVLTNGGSQQEVQQAFNDLATAYLYSTGTLEQLNEETANAIKKQLEQMGVTNAEAVVTEALTLPYHPSGIFRCKAYRAL